ncbi:DUF2759 family protein [Paraliobacillus sp. JSM ZJ581]|uniref:DUF2759 family protein n=1 Tax=Paraliobacillus sp. JSM ZJ581 TaxID=3342118 RepID=UPI0035A94272
MPLALTLMMITCLSSAAFCKEMKSKNLTALLVTGSSVLIFGFFSISTIMTSFF